MTRGRHASGDADDRLRRIAAHVPGVIFQLRLDPDGTSCFPYASEGIRAVFAVTPEEVRDDAAPVFRRLHPDDLAGVAEAIRASAQRLEPWRQEYRVVLPDGLRWLRGEATPQREADGGTLWHGYIADITEAKRRERTVAELGERLRLGTRSAGIGIWEYRIADDALLWDEQMHVVYGTRPDSFGRRLADWRATVVGEDAAPVERALDALIAHDRPFTEVFRIRRPDDGRIRWIRAAGAVVRDADGEPLRVIGINADVTDQTVAEQALRRSEEQLQLVLDATGEGIWDWRLDEDVVLHNRRWCDILGLDASFTRHATAAFIAHLHEDDRERVMTRVRGCLEQGVPYRSEHRMRRADGSVVWVLDRGMVAARAADGRPLRMVGSIADITDRHRAEERLQDALTRLDRFFSLALDLLCIATLDGRFVRINKGWEEVLGYRQAELEGSSFLSLVHPDDIQPTLSAMTRLGEGGIVHRFTNRYRHKDGSYRRIAWRSHPGGDGLVYAAARDVTEAHAAEQALIEAKERAEAANQAKSSFLANMSHEIRTPMNGVLGMAELLLGTGLDAEQEEYARTIVSSSEALLTVINDILDFSRIESGKLAIEEVRFDLPTLIYDGIEPFRARIAGGAVELAVRIDPALPRWQVGDPGRLRQVLVNLVGNAVKFTARGHILVEATAADGRLLLGIADTGIGIPRERQKALFQPFEQADGSTSRRYGGSGLGLAICRRLAVLLGGTVELESEPGRGTRLTVDLPLRPSPDQGEGSGARTVVLRGRRALVADGLPVNRGILLEQLARRGVAVDVAADGAEACARLAAQTYDVALIDLRLQGLDSAQYAREALRLQPHLRLVALSLTGQREEAAAAEQAGYHGYVVKPCPDNALVGVLGRVLAGERGVFLRQRLRETAPARSCARGDELQGRHVLLVEDNRTNQRVARLMLERLGARVEVADDGAAALTAIATERPDLVLMDLQMPGMDGLEATAEIRRREAAEGLARLPIVALTANAMVGDRERCLAIGMDGHLAKPLRVEALVALLGGRPATEPEPSAPPPRLRMPPSPPPPEALAAPGGPAIDATVRAQLAALGPEAASVYGDFAADLPQRCLAIAAAAAAGDLVAMAQAAHALKGVAATLGCLRLAAAATTIDHGGRAGHRPDAADLATLAIEAAAVRDAIAGG